MILYPTASIQGRRYNPTFINLLTFGTDFRESETGSFIGAPTTGLTPYYRWWGWNVRAVEDLGNGNGPMVLVQGERTNELAPSPSVGILAARDAAAIQSFGL